MPRLADTGALPPSRLCGSVFLTFVLLLIWSAILRLPYTGNVGEDEVFFALVGQRWLDGLLPYVASFDVKPPGIFAVFALAQAVFGMSVATIKGLELFSVAGSALGLYLIGTRHFSKAVGWFAATLYPLYCTVALSGVKAPTELVQAPFTIFAALATMEAVRGGGLRWVVMSATLLGAAASIKQPAAFVALALIASTCWYKRRGRLHVAVLFLVALSIVPLAFLLIYILNGQALALLEGAVFGAAGRLHGDNIGFVSGIIRFFPMSRPLLVLVCLTLLVMTRGRWLRGGPLAAGTAVALAWLAGEVTGIIAMRAMYDHYFLTLVPPLTLLAGVGLFHLTGAGQRSRPILIIPVLVAATLVPFAFGGRGVSLPGTDVSFAVARELASLGLSPKKRILIVNRGMLIYLLAKDQPTSRYFHPEHLLCDFPAPDVDPLKIALSSQPIALVLADTKRRMVCERPDRWAEVKSAIAANYSLVAHVPGKFDSFDIFRRRSPDTKR